MTTQAPQDTRQPQQQPQQPQGSGQQQDPLAVMIQEIANDRRRLKALQNPTPDQLKIELAATTLDYVDEIVKHLLQVRNHLLSVQSWNENTFQEFNDRLEDVETDGSSDGTQLLPEDSQILLDVIASAKALAESMFNLTEPMPVPDEEGKAMLQALVLKCEVAAQLVGENTLQDDDDDDDKDGGEDDGGDDGEDANGAS